jgi:glycogen synthase
MYGLRYGAVPVVHATGGLDTIEAYEPALGPWQRFQICAYDAEALLSTLQRALTLYHDRDAWMRLMQRACTTSPGRNLPRHIAALCYCTGQTSRSVGAGVRLLLLNYSFRV